MLKMLFSERFWQNNLVVNSEVRKLALQFRVIVTWYDHIVNTIYVLSPVSDLP